MRFRRTLTLLVALGLLSGVWHPGQAQAPTREYFFETGHWVVGDFLAFYHSVPDPLLVFGYPLTEEFTDSAPATRVQYFQRARFELDPAAPAGSRVHLGALGSLILDRTRIRPGNLDTNTPLCRPFRNGETYYVCYAFLAFYDDHGGAALFGAPITNYVREGDRFVQYFERARFEWYPELSANEWVRLADVGRIQFDLAQRDPSLLAPVQGIFSPGQVTVTGLVPRAFVARPVIKSPSSQTIFVVVRDQNLQPLSQVKVDASVFLPDGVERQLKTEITDNDGIARVNFSLDTLPINQTIRVKILVTFSDLTATTYAWFRTWW